MIITESMCFSTWVPEHVPLLSCERCGAAVANTYPTKIKHVEFHNWVERDK